MENIDKLTTIAKCLFDVRVAQQRREIEDLKKEIKNNSNDLNKYYLVIFAEEGSRTISTTLLQTLSEGDEFEAIAKMDRIRYQFEDDNRELAADGEDAMPDIINYVKLLIKDNEIILMKLNELKTCTLFVDPGHLETYTTTVY